MRYWLVWGTRAELKAKCFAIYVQISRVSSSDVEYLSMILNSRQRLSYKGLPCRQWLETQTVRMRELDQSLCNDLHFASFWLDLSKFWKSSLDWNLFHPFPLGQAHVGRGAAVEFFSCNRRPKALRNLNTCGEMSRPRPRRLRKVLGWVAFDQWHFCDALGDFGLKRLVLLFAIRCKAAVREANVWAVARRKRMTPRN